MRQITCGETPKTKIYSRKEIDIFLKSINEDFDRVFDQKTCIYGNSLKSVDNTVLNFLNSFDSQCKSEHLKSILKKEFDDCEITYPYLGDLFIMKFFGKKCIKNNNFILNKQNKSSFINSIQNYSIKKICEEIFDGISLERTINVKTSMLDEIVLRKVNDVYFKVNFDTDFLGDKKEIEVKNYRYILIDGFIESIGEIYHLLHFAAKSKESYMIFCFGMSEEVKNVIIQNNSNGKTQIIPISMSMDESTINILNDLALIHDCDVISSLKGQTISQETRKELPVGVRAVVNRSGIYFDPVCDQKKIRSHVAYLKKRIDNSPPDVNIEVIKDRMRNINSKSVNLFIPSKFLSDVSIAREIDYVIRFLSFCEKNMSTFHTSADRKVFIPEVFVQYANKKVNSIKNTFYNLEKLVLFEEL